ncbi:MAG: DNA-binding transcriptional regulator OxyR [Cycloclasticus sp. symbiont of Bathymodiolus heckerae]|nr:MAG: DNA-binding transcriptional regulator OxyR [Cycloclasticus sp. symbiont of Bathymodiolus heckerae]
MNLRDLKYIVAVAELKSFVQAAQQCFVSQPTLSMQIKKLEETLGVKIFERNNKHVLVTEVGEHIIATAKRALQEVTLIEELSRNAQNPLAGNFTLGAFPTLASYILPALVPRIKMQLPDIRLILVEEKTDALIQQLKNGELDAALLAAPIHDEYLHAEPLFDDVFKLAVSTQHPLAKQKTVSSDDLANEPLLLLDEGHCLRDQALQFCQLNNATEEQNVRATSLETLRQMVKANTGITFIPEIAIQGNDDDIRYIPFVEPQPKRSICLVWRKTNPRHTLMTEIKRLLVK